MTQKAILEDFALFLLSSSVKRVSSQNILDFYSLYIVGFAGIVELVCAVSVDAPFPCHTRAYPALLRIHRGVCQQQSSLASATRRVDDKHILNNFSYFSFVVLMNECGDGAVDATLSRPAHHPNR